MKQPGTCPREERLTAFLLEECDAAETERIEKHLAECPRCQALLRELEPTLELLGKALAADAQAPGKLDDAHRARALDPPGRGRLLAWPRLGTRVAQAAAVLLVVGGAAFWLSTKPATLETARAPAPQAAGETARVEQDAFQAPAPGVQALTMEEAPQPPAARAFSAARRSADRPAEAPPPPDRDTAVRRGLAWLVARQQDDGSWGDIEATRAGVLALLVHEADGLPEPQLAAMEKGVAYLVGQDEPPVIGRDYQFGLASREEVSEPLMAAKATAGGRTQERQALEESDVRERLDRVKGITVHDEFPLTKPPAAWADAARPTGEEARRLLASQQADGRWEGNEEGRDDVAATALALFRLGLIEEE